MQSLRSDEACVRTTTLSWSDRAKDRGQHLPGLLGPLAASTDDADQPLRTQRDGPAGEELSQAEHGSVPLQVGRRRGCRHVEEGDHSVVTSRLPIMLVRASRVAIAIVSAAACTSPSTSSVRPTLNAAPRAGWVDSVLATMSPHD